MRSSLVPSFQLGVVTCARNNELWGIAIITSLALILNVVMIIIKPRLDNQVITLIGFEAGFFSLLFLPRSNNIFYKLSMIFAFLTILSSIISITIISNNINILTLIFIIDLITSILAYKIIDGDKFKP